MNDSPSDTKPAKPSIQFKEIKELKFQSAVLGLDQEADGSKLFAACLDGGVYEVAISTDERRKLVQHANYCSSVRRIAGGSRIVSAGYDGVLVWHDLAKNEPLQKITAHKFWSWRMTASKDGRYVASVTGQYQCGGYKYEPREEAEPSVRVFDGESGKLLRSWPMLPPVQAVAISPDNRQLAAGNLMGDVRVWSLETGEELASWRTDSFTGWGIIKGHYYTGGIYALEFSPDGEALLAAGMGSTTDPAAGNGKQLWQRFNWREKKKIDEAADADIGRGLMETLAYHPGGEWFVMAGRLFNGKWNTALFDAAKGGLLHALDSKMRTTTALFSTDGKQLFLAGTTDQGKKKDGKFPECGRIKIYEVKTDSAAS